MRRITAVLMTAIMLVTMWTLTVSAANEDGMTSENVVFGISTYETSGLKAGDTFTINITVNQVNNIAMVEYYMAYDNTKVKAISSELAGIVSEMDMMDCVVEPASDKDGNLKTGEVWLTGMTLDQLTSAEGEVISTVTFEALVDINADVPMYAVGEPLSCTHEMIAHTVTTTAGGVKVPQSGNNAGGNDTPNNNAGGNNTPNNNAGGNNTPNNNAGGNNTPNNNAGGNNTPNNNAGGNNTPNNNAGGNNTPNNNAGDNNTPNNNAGGNNTPNKNAGDNNTPNNNMSGDVTNNDGNAPTNSQQANAVTNGNVAPTTNGGASDSGTAVTTTTQAGGIATTELFDITTTTPSGETPSTGEPMLIVVVALAVVTAAVAVVFVIVKKGKKNESNDLQA